MILLVEWVELGDVLVDEFRTPKWEILDKVAIRHTIRLAETYPAGEAMDDSLLLSCLL